MSAIAVGLIGAGTVGGGVVKLLRKKADYFRNSMQLPVCLGRVADKEQSRLDALEAGDAVLSQQAADVLQDDSIQIVLELVGGTGFARQLVLDALNGGKHVVTANKALIAEHGPELFDAAAKNNVSLYFEAAVGGGMPSIKTIRESMVANDILSVKCIINGTCNYILSEMSRRGSNFEETLKEAQEKGYAEADPTLDIGGGDSGHKVAIMASLAYGGYVPFDKISIEGIETITQQDIAVADQLGYTIKLLGVIARDNDAVDVRVHPSMVKKSHILSSVHESFNAIFLEGDAVGDIVLYGRGAGELPTASAVVSDIIDCARDIQAGVSQRISTATYTAGYEIPLKPIERLEARYYLRFSVVDKPGVLASIAASLGRKDISIASVMQKEGAESDSVPVIILTHRAREKNLRDALQTIESADFIKAATQVIRIEE